MNSTRFTQSKFARHPGSVPGEYPHLRNLACSAHDTEKRVNISAACGLGTGAPGNVVEAAAARSTGDLLEFLLGDRLSSGRGRQHHVHGFFRPFSISTLVCVSPRRDSTRLEGFQFVR